MLPWLVELETIAEGVDDVTELRDGRLSVEENRILEVVEDDRLVKREDELGMCVRTVEIIETEAKEETLDMLETVLLFTEDVVTDKLG